MKSLSEYKAPSIPEGMSVLDVLGLGKELYSVKTTPNETKEPIEQIVEAYIALLPENMKNQLESQYREQYKKEKEVRKGFEGSSGYQGIGRIEDWQIELLIPTTTRLNLEDILKTKIDKTTPYLISRERILSEMTAYITDNADEVKKLIEEEYKKESDGEIVFANVMTTIYKAARDKIIEEISRKAKPYITNKLTYNYIVKR